MRSNLADLLYNKLYFQLEKGRRNNQNKIIRIRNACYLSIPFAQTFLLLFFFLKLYNNNKCTIQINVNECIQNPGKCGTQRL